MTWYLVKLYLYFYLYFTTECYDMEFPGVPRVNVGGGSVFI
jgi:hypothetical protein